MRVLVVGGGGREHALSWALARSATVEEVVCAPGNAGITEVATVVPVDMRDVDAVVHLARAHRVDLVVVGPEAPLVAGLADALAVEGIPVFGPTAEGARIEGSKAFAKEVMAAAGVATARHWSGDDAAAAKEALRSFSAPYVVKADGLAAGKGVRICENLAEAEDAVDDAMLRQVFGAAGTTVVVEEFLDGPEISLFAVCGGGRAVPLVPAKDYKRALDGGVGLNTGGMGAYSPVPAVSDDMVAALGWDVFVPVLEELAKRGIDYTGVLYAGLVLTDTGPKVLEFNARFGDPETQVVLPRLRSDLGELLLAAAEERLDDIAPLDWDDRACVTVVLASAGYPATYDTGFEIFGLADAGKVADALVFHAGTARDAAGQVVTDGGRVLAVSGLGSSMEDARERAYLAADQILFHGSQRRSDIAVDPLTA
jgi:phosphoribosylamine---glycine ligase